MEPAEPAMATTGHCREFRNSSLWVSSPTLHNISLQPVILEPSKRRPQYGHQLRLLTSSYRAATVRERYQGVQTGDIGNTPDRRHG
jgi:hypothetical protein